MDNNSGKTQTYLFLTNGTMVSHYRIVRKIGSGGMGEVYLAEDTELDRKVALKFLASQLCQDDDCRARFKREAQAAARLNHPNIVTVYDVSEYNGHPFFAMEYIEGTSLDNLIKKDNLDLDTVINLTIQICEGLNEAHQSGVTHRDIKPGNIIIDSKGKPHLLDFGLATVTGKKKLTKTGSTLGTIGYMSPEQVRGENVDHRSDIFSLGVILYETLTGSAPFAQVYDAATINAILNENPRPLRRFRADIPEIFQNIVDTALNKRVENRYQNIKDLHADLKLAMQETSTIEPRKLPHYRARKPRVLYLAVPAIILVGIFLWLKWSGRFDTTPAKKHIAVLPFTSLGEVPAPQAFCDGLIETLASQLTQMDQFQGTLYVVPASEVREKKVTSVRQARKIFGVTHAVTGSVQKRDSEIRMTINLVDAKTDRQLRSKVIDEKMENVSSLQDSIVAELEEMLEIHLHPRDRRILKAGGTASPAAYYSYLQASGYLQRYESAKSIDSAIDLFSDAIEQDPNYALAYAGLGKAYWQKYNLNMDVQWVDPATKYSQLALELSNDLAPVFVTLGVIYNGTGRYKKAVGFFEQALRIDSVDHNALSGLAKAYEALGKFNQAEATYKRVIELKPADWNGYYKLALFYLYRGGNQEALRQLRRAELLAPDAVLPCNDLGGLYLYLGYNNEAAALLERSLELEPNYSAFSNLGALYMREKRYSEAAGMYERALDLDDTDYRVWINLASIYEALPDRHDKAIAIYKRAIQMAEEHLAVNPNDPLLLCYLADCYFATGNNQRSLDLAEKAIILAPDNVEILVRVGLIYEESGRRDKAMALISKAVNNGFPIDEIKNYQELRNLLADPRFDSLIS